jgi:uncharacterized alkaline shock family protein YloU
MRGEEGTMLYPIENELVHQKDRILALVNEEEYEKALFLLNFVTELWVKVEYGYKISEIKERIKGNIRELIREADHHQTVAKWERMLQKVC